MKFTLLIAGASAISLRESKPLIHPQTGLAITTTGQHWYGQPPLAMSQVPPIVPVNEGNPNPVDLKVDSWTNPQNAPTLVQRSDKDVGVTHYDPWVRVVVAANVNPVPWGGRATSPDGSYSNPTSVENGGYASGFTVGASLAQAAPVENHCTNPNKATGVDEDCSAAGNSAWTTFSSSRTAAPKDA